MADRSGQQLGNYQLTRLLGEGGFAEVYLGQHIYLKTQAAIKVLQTQLASDDIESFLNEARTIANLVHPNIVRVLDFGIDGKTPFLVMDYAQNGTLRQRHAKGTRMAPATIVAYIKQIATGLQYAHDQKLIHRDIKPENLLIGRHEDILLSDFGIALVAQSSRYQSTQDVVGTVAYMSPEQIQGKPRAASDQYSLGIVTYEWLTGDRPFHGSFTELCAQHMFAPPPPIRERNPTITPALEQVVNIALAKEPKQRFMTVQAFATALEQASVGQRPTIVKPPDSQLLTPSQSSLPPTVQRAAPSSPRLAPTQFANMASMPLAGSPVPKPRARVRSILRILFYFMGAFLAGGGLGVALYPGFGANRGGTGLGDAVWVVVCILSIPALIIVVSRHKQVRLNTKKRIIFALIATCAVVVFFGIESTQSNLVPNVAANFIADIIVFLYGLSCCVLALW